MQQSTSTGLVIGSTGVVVAHNVLQVWFMAGQMLVPSPMPADVIPRIGPAPSEIHYAYTIPQPDFIDDLGHRAWRIGSSTSTSTST